MSEPLDLDALERLFTEPHSARQRGEGLKLIAELRATRAERDQSENERLKIIAELADFMRTDDDCLWAERARRAESAIARVAAVCAEVAVEYPPDYPRWIPIGLDEVRAALRGDHA